MDLKDELKRAGVRLRELAHLTGESQSTISRVLDLQLRAKVEEGAYLLINKKITELKSWGSRYPDIKQTVKPTVH
tara:strand:- start:1578 stop:1802 length:225 start_codon:yes stop_codon:yes gene_type:complete